MRKEIQLWTEFVTGCLDRRAEPAFSLLAGDGSTRRFYRVTGLERPSVLMVNPGPPRHEQRGVDENDTWVYLAGLFREIGVEAPLIYGYDRSNGLILIEDLGDCLLQQAVLEKGPDSEWTAGTYRRLLDALLTIQLEGMRRLEENRLFNLAYTPDFMLRWEGLYFSAQFAGRLCGYASPELEKELAALAALAGERMSGRVLIYRDFQSRNVMLGPDDILRFVDFQGARPGPPAYDVASLLFDPYVPLSESLRLELTGYYHAALASRDTRLADQFQAQFPLIAAHRLMQALGAYAKLALADGKREFLRYTMPALKDLRHLLEQKEFTPFGTLRRAVDCLNPPQAV